MICGFQQVSPNLQTDSIREKNIYQNDTIKEVKSLDKLLNREFTKQDKSKKNTK